MLGLMQDQPLLIPLVLRHAARHHGTTEIVSKTAEGPVHRTSYARLDERARRLARVLQRLGVRAEDRVATLAWNGFRHLELYYAISGIGAICHTLNPRLSVDDLAYIVTDAADVLVFADTSFAPILGALSPAISATVRTVVFLCGRADMPDIPLPKGMELLCYEELMAESDEDFAWPVLDERSAASLCYTSGTTGRPKGVLYSHRSTILHAWAVNTADAMALRAVDRMLAVVPMFHVNAWGLPYAAPMAGAAIVMPGRHLDGESLAALMNEEAVTVSAGVPTVWLRLLHYLRSSGTRLATVTRLVIGGAACPPSLIEAFEREYGIRVDHAWGMTETSPVGVFNRPKPGLSALTADAARRQREKQGRALFGIDIRIVSSEGDELPWDGQTQGNLMARGPWVCSAYFGPKPVSACDAEGWFATGDVATIDPDGMMEITDRTKDVIKSGGEWISSIALENIAVCHPDVAEAAVIAASHPKWSERPLLIVVARSDQEPAKESVLATYRGKVSDWWIPDDMIVLDELPHTATGKVHKLALRERFRDYLIRRDAASGEGDSGPMSRPDDRGGG
jgi:fatty-acyl-CoA synthase